MTDSDGEDADVCDEVPSTSENHHALDVLRRTISAGSGSDKTTARFYAFQAAFLTDVQGKKSTKEHYGLFQPTVVVFC